MSGSDGAAAPVFTAVAPQNPEAGDMRKLRNPLKTGRFLAYVLGREPQAFGLVPDEEGFVGINELLKALGEEEGWRHVRRSHINEVMLVLPDPPVEVAEASIRAVERRHLPPLQADGSPPRLLYTCVRRRAYPRVAERGVHPAGGGRVVLAADRDMALRIGRRSDASPVLLTVQTAAAAAAGIVFRGIAGTLYVSGRLPRGCFTGPPLPAEPAPRKKQEAPAPAEETTPGSFRIRELPETVGRPGEDRKRRKKEIAWKKGRREQIKIRKRRG